MVVEDDPKLKDEQVPRLGVFMAHEYEERDDDEQADELAQEDAYHHWVEGGKEH